MANVFTFVGKMKLNEGGKLPTYEEKSFDSGWKMRTTRLNVVAQGNSHNIEITGGYGGEYGTVYSMIKNASGKFENIQFTFSDREKYIKDIADFKKSVIVLGDERFEFCTQVELAKFVHDKLKNNVELQNRYYRIQGEIEYSEYEGKIYTKYNANRIYLINTEEFEEKSEASIELFVDDNCILDDNFDETSKMMVRGYVTSYDSKRKGLSGYPQMIEIDLSENKQKLKFKMKLEELFEKKQSDDTLSKIGLKCNVIAKSDSVEFNENMLDEDEKELLEMGLMDLETLKAKHGAGKGNFERKLVFKGLARNYSTGVLQTTETLESLLSRVDIPKKKTFTEIDNSPLDDNDFEGLTMVDDEEIPF